MRGSNRLGRTNLLSLVLLVGLAAGVWSSAASVSAQGGLPTRPAVHTIATLHQGLRVYWYEPGEDGGSAITGYDVEYRSVGSEQWTDAGHTGTSQPALITGLRFNTSYEVRVRARNANGAGSWSSVESRRTSRDDGKPDRPWPPTLEPGDGRIEVSWTAPAYTGGRAITGYHVRYTTDNAATWRTWAPGGNRLIASTTTTITGLDNGVTVGVAVGAINARGQGLYSLPFSEAAPAPMLTLSLESSRQLCTANTLTELSWTITGGVPPYTLTIESEEVEPDTESHRANCGPLTTDPLTGDPLLSQKRTFSAAVTDARGVATAGAAAVDLAPPLPALEPVPEGYSAVSSYRFGLGFKWSTGAAHRLCGIADCFAIRWRGVHSEDWAYAPMTHGLDPRTGNRPFSFVWGLSDGGMYEAAGAAMRDPIELETPGALRWTSPVRGTTLTDPTGLSATATHDTVTVRWDRQPAARQWDVLLQGPNGSLTKRTHRYRFPADASWGDPASKFHEVVFRDVPSDTRFKVLVKWSLSEGFLDARSETVVRTHTPPPGHQPLPRGPQNLRATATHDSITVKWDRPFEGDSSHYVVFLFHPEYSSTGRVAYAFPPDTEVTYTGLDAEVSYRVSVIHEGIVQSRGQLIVQTKAAPPSSDGVRGAGGIPGLEPMPWVLPGDFDPVWPHALRTSAGKWSVLTDDVWVSRGDRWHAGMDTGLLLRAGPRQQIQAVADGILREYDPEVQGFVLFCPGSSESSALIDHVQLNTNSNSKTEDGNVDCTELANRYHGRVALTFHQYANTFYVVQYAHLHTFGSASDSRKAPSPRSRRIEAGDPIGTEGETGVGDKCELYEERDGEKVCIRWAWDEKAYAPHLHITIRWFSNSNAATEVSSAQGGTWREIDRMQNWSCSGDDVRPTYCEGPERSILTVIDPEAVLPPPPPATVLTSARSEMPARDGTQHVDKSGDVDDVHTRFVIRGVGAPDPLPEPLPPEAQRADVQVALDLAVWRPRFYTYNPATAGAPARFATQGLAGTKDGVTGYFASGSNCAGFGKNAEGSKIAFAEIDDTKPVFWSEVAPFRINLLMSRGESACAVTAHSYNELHRPFTSLPEAPYGRNSDSTVWTPDRVTGTIDLHASKLALGTSPKTVQGASLRSHEFDIYQFDAEDGYRHEFVTVGDSDDNIALQVWTKAGAQTIEVSGAAGTALEWDANETGTAYLVVHGRFSDATQWTGTYGLQYSRTPLGRCIPLLEVGGQAASGSSASTDCRPRVPMFERVESTSDSITVRWNDVSPVAVPGTVRYEPRINNEAAQSPNQPDGAGTRSHRFDSRPSASKHEIRIRALIGTRNSGWSGPLAVHTLLPTPVIDTDQVNATVRTATFAWGEVTGADGYEVRRVPDGETETLGNVRSHEFGGLDPSKDYGLSVRATLTTNSEVTSAWASTTVTTTAGQCPSPRPPKPAASGYRPLGTATTWAQPSGGKTAELESEERQPQTRSVTWNAAECRWDAGEWGDVGDSYWTTPAPTGVTRSAPAKPAANDYRPLGTATTWAQPSGGKTAELESEERQPQTRSVTWNAAECQWDAGEWGDVGDSYWTTPAPTGVTRSAPAKPAANDYRPLGTATTWAQPSGGKTAELESEERQPQTRSVTWNAAECQWDAGEWGDVGDSYWTTPSPTGETRPAPAKPIERELRDRKTEGRSEVRGTTAYKQSRQVATEHRRTVSWDESQCRWDPGDWDDGVPWSTPWKDTGEEIERPPTRTWTTRVNEARTGRTRVIRVQSTPICLEQTQEQLRYRIRYSAQAYVWDGDMSWVPGTVTSTTPPVWHTRWRDVGSQRLCRIGGQDDEAAAADAGPSFEAGQHTLQWGTVWLRFTVPAGSSVLLTARADATRELTAVFSLAGGAELIVSPSALARDERPTSTDPTLASLATSLALVEEPQVASAQSGDTACATATPGAPSAATRVDLDASDCTLISGGGSVVLVAGKASRTLTLPEGREWIAFAAPVAQGNGSDAFWLIDAASGSLIVLDPGSGNELARQLTDGSAELKGLLDGIAASADD